MYCEPAQCGLDSLQNEFGYDELINIENHVRVDCGVEPFETPETVARAQWYDVDGIPTVRIDGKYSAVGAVSCSTAYNQYRGWVVQRQAETSQLSPIEITGSYAVAGAEITMHGSFRLVDPVMLPELRATLLVYEDNIQATSQQFFDDTWQHVTRVIADSPITLGAAGDEAVVAMTADVGVTWNPDQLHVVAYVQRTTGDKEIYQAAFLPRAFAVSVTPSVQSVPAGNGEALFQAVLRNTAAGLQSFVVQPGTGFGDWAVDFSGCGQPVFSTDPIEIALEPGAECPLTLRVHTSGQREIRAGGLRISSLELEAEARSRVFNGSPAVMLMDSRDAVDPVYAPISGVLEDLGVLFDDWRVADPPPSVGQLAGFDLLICDTEYYGPGVFYYGAPADSVLAGFMDVGGGVFLTGQGWLDEHPVDPFLRDYFGVAGALLQQRYTAVVGVSGDVIGDGLDLPLQFAQSYWNHDDLIMTTPAASPFLVTATQRPSAIRNVTPSGTRTAFMAFPFSTISTVAADPNNQRTVLRRVIDWLNGSTASSVGESVSAPTTTRLDGPRPNPFSGRVEVGFALSPRATAGPVRLEVFEPSGRRVARLFDGNLPLGAHTLTWDGRTDAGAPATSGAYFVRLETADGAQSRGMILLGR